MATPEEELSELQRKYALLGARMAPRSRDAIAIAVAVVPSLARVFPPHPSIVAD